MVVPCPERAEEILLAGDVARQDVHLQHRLQGGAEGHNFHHLHSTASSRSPTATPSLRSWRNQDQLSDSEIN